MSQPERSPLILSAFRSVVTRLRLPWGWLRRVDATEDQKEADDQQQAAKLRTQVKVIERALDGDVAMAGGDGLEPTDDPADVAYLYRPRTALVTRDWVQDVERFFTENSRRFTSSPELSETRLSQLVRMTMPARTDGRDPVLATLADLDKAFADEIPRRGPVATPDHLLYVTTIRGGLCPACEPEEPQGETPVPRFDADPSWGRGVRVSVVDTGLWEPAKTLPVTPWLHAGVVADPADDEVIDPSAIHEYGGHGTFVAGVIKCAAPAVHIQVQGALTHGGAVYESELVEQLHEAYGESDDPQLISMSAGTHSRRDFALISFDALADALGLRGSETLLVAAAGNDGSERPFWPAAFDWAIGVGSVDADGTVSDYSNYGPWVNAYARGRDHINAFPVGTYTCYEPANAGQVRHFRGLAQWSGTSFSTPVVTGLVAAEKSRSTQDVRTIAHDLIAAGSAGTDPAGNPIRIVGPLT
jgi:hypothetical protein